MYIVMGFVMLNASSCIPSFQGLGGAPNYIFMNLFAERSIPSCKDLTKLSFPFQVFPALQAPQVLEYYNLSNMLQLCDWIVPLKVPPNILINKIQMNMWLTTIHLFVPVYALWWYILFLFKVPDYGWYLPGFLVYDAHKFVSCFIWLNLILNHFHLFLSNVLSLRLSISTSPGVCLSSLWNCPSSSFTQRFYCFSNGYLWYDYSL